MNVLSLFDGMSCGQQALDRLRVKVDNYFASEIDKYAIQVTMANYPNTQQLGSVVNVDGHSLPKIDLLMGGSPCQSFSFAGKRKGMSTKCETEILTLEHYLELKAEGYEFEGQSYLFWEYMRLLNECKPTYFLLENVEMGEKWEKVLSKAIGVNGIHINSALVSAQNRKRIYWTNIGMQPSGLFGDLESIIEQPKDRKILLKDILETKVQEKYFLSEKMINTVTGPLSRADGKTYCLDTGNTNAVELPAIYDDYNGNIRKDGKTCTLTVNSGSKAKRNGQKVILDTGNTNAVEIVLKNKDKRLKKIVDNNIFIEGEVAHLDTYNQTIDKDKSPALKLPHNDRFIIAPTKSINAVEIVAMRGRGENNEQQLEARKDGKTNCLTSVQKDNLIKQLNPSLESGGKQPYQQNRVYDIDGISPALQAQLPHGSNIINTSRIRRLTPIECERLQTVADNYTNHVSDSQRYKMLGNGWTIDVIAHILNYAF